MNKLKLTGVIFFALLTILDCSAQTERSSGGDYDIRGQVTSVNRERNSQNPRLHARITVEPGSEASAAPNDRAVVFITDDTRLYERRGESRAAATFDALAVGQFVCQVSRSYLMTKVRCVTCV